MSHPTTDPNVQNGLPHKWDGSKPPFGNQYPLNNGLGGSSQSSRDSSPIPRFSNVPQSQLPPSRGQIPSSQLPPGRISVSPIIGQQNLKSASYLLQNTTPISSPAINTSTPIMRRTDNSAGNILTGNNSYVNTSAQSVPLTMPNDINVRKPQTNGQTNKQNLNQPLLISSMESKHTGNLLTNQLDQQMPAFVPVNAQTMFPVPPNTNQDNTKNNDSEEKQLHFMNPIPQPKITPMTQQNIPAIEKLINSTAGLFPSGNEPKPTEHNLKDNQNDNRIPTPKSIPSVSVPNQQNSLLSSALNPNVLQLGNQMLLSGQSQNMPPISLNGPPQMAQNPFTVSGGAFAQSIRQPNQSVGAPMLPGANQSVAAPKNQQGRQPNMYQQLQTTSPNQKPPTGSGVNQIHGNVVPPPIISQSSGNLPPMSSTVNQNQGNVASAPMTSHSSGKVLPPSSMTNQNQGNVSVPPIGNQFTQNQSSMSYQSAGFKQFQPSQSNQSTPKSLSPPLMSNQNQGTMNQNQQGPLGSQSGGFQFLPCDNQFGPKPTLSNQNIGSMMPQSQQGDPVISQSGVMPPMHNQGANITPGNMRQQPPLANQMPPMPNQMPPMPNQMPPMPNQSQQGLSLTNQSATMPPLSSSGSVPPSLFGPPLPSQNANNMHQHQQGPPQSGVMPTLLNQNAGFQQYQNNRQPMPSQGPGLFPPQQQPPNQNMGYQQYGQITNQNIGKPPNIYPTPLQNQVPTSQYGQFTNQNKPNQPSQNYPQMGHTNVNQSLVGPPPTSMATGQNINQNKPQIPPPMYNSTNLGQQKPQEPASYPSTPTSALHKNRYAQNYEQTATYSTQNRQNAPNQMYQQSYGQNYQSLHQGMSNMNLGQTGFNRIYGSDYADLLQCPNVLPQERIEPPRVCLGQECLSNANCSPEIFRCTMTKIPETNAILQKSRLPLGVLIHPFKDLNHLPVIQCSSIVRCRACRTYINPFVYFVDTKRWKCNLCYRVNELPEEFQYDPVSKSYGDPSRRPEIKSSTIEYIAPSEYMLRPPQPAVYLFLLDVSRLAIESGYLHTICEVLSTQLQNLPGDSRTQIGFICYNSTLHFYSLGEGISQPHEMTVLDIDDIFLPCPDNLLVNLKERMELVTDLLALLPTRFINSYDNGSALGAAIQAAFKLMSPTGGRVTIFQCLLPTIGPGMLTSREDPNQRAGKEAPHLNPATDFYKRMALECSGHQVAVDLFLLNSQYIDIATLSGISRFSGGCMHHFPLYKASKSIHAESLERCFKRYLTRKIGFEAVMRIRCTRGLAIHTFHGNLFVRSTDLLSLPNINPDAGFGMQVSIEESLSDLQNVCFQAALLYTSSKGERRIRVHTLCLPVCNNLPDIINSADQQCIIGVLSKMAVDRSLQSSLSDARDAFINVAIDILHSYKVSLNMGEAGSGLLASHNLKLLPMYILALLKHPAFRTGLSTRLDDRVFAMCEMKTMPLCYLIQQVYPDLYPVHNLTDEGGAYDSEGTIIPQPPRLQLTSRNIDGFGAYLLDCGQQMIIFVCQKVSPSFLTHVLGVPNFNSISDQFHELPKIDNPDNQRLHTFITSLNDEKPYCASLHIMRENSPNRAIFLEKLIEDRMESALSYNEFLQHIKTQVK